MLEQYADVIRKAIDAGMTGIVVLLIAAIIMFIVLIYLLIRVVSRLADRTLSIQERSVKAQEDGNTRLAEANRQSELLRLGLDTLSTAFKDRNAISRTIQTSVEDANRKLDGLPDAIAERLARSGSVLDTILSGQQQLSRDMLQFLNEWSLARQKLQLLSEYATENERHRNFVASSLMAQLTAWNSLEDKLVMMVSLSFAETPPAGQLTGGTLKPYIEQQEARTKEQTHVPSETPKHIDPTV